MKIHFGGFAKYRMEYNKWIDYNKINFDSDALNLKDENLQSVVLAKQLIEKNPTSDYIISVVLDKKDFDKITLF